MLIAERALGVEHELRARREVDLSVAEAPDADLRALQIHQHADGAARLARELAHQLDALPVLVGRAVGEIHAHDVEPGRDHARESLRIARGGAERGDDLGAAEYVGHPGVR